MYSDSPSLAYHSSDPRWSIVYLECGRHRSYRRWKDNPRVKKKKIYIYTHTHIPIRKAKAVLESTSTTKCHLYIFFFKAMTLPCIWNTDTYVVTLTDPGKRAWFHGEKMHRDTNTANWRWTQRCPVTLIKSWLLHLHLQKTQILAKNITALLILLLVYTLVLVIVTYPLQCLILSWKKLYHGEKCSSYYCLETLTIKMELKKMELNQFLKVENTPGWGIEKLNCRDVSFLPN